MVSGVWLFLGYLRAYLLCKFVVAFLLQTDYLLMFKSIMSMILVLRIISTSIVYLYKKGHSTIFFILFIKNVTNDRESKLFVNEFLIIMCIFCITSFPAYKEENIGKTIEWNIFMEKDKVKILAGNSHQRWSQNINPKRMCSKNWSSPFEGFCYAK